MKGTILLKGFIGVLFIISIPQLVLANDSKPGCNFTMDLIAFNSIQSDTLPPATTITAGTNDNPAPNIIKEVPKARRLPVPIPVSVNVKPVIMIKPKIIKPLIRVLH
jgi:hypothetical protein